MTKLEKMRDILALMKLRNNLMEKVNANLAAIIENPFTPEAEALAKEVDLLQSELGIVSADLRYQLEEEQWNS